MYCVLSDIQYVVCLWLLRASPQTPIKDVCSDGGRVRIRISQIRISQIRQIRLCKLCYGISASTLTKLQRSSTPSAQMFFHLTPISSTLLPIKHQINFKIATLT